MISSLQILRGIAALMVVFPHIQPQLDHFGGPTLSWLPFGSSGVDIFFVISGFIIWVTCQSPAMSPEKFAVRRFIRIVPLYWLVTGFVATVALVAPSMMSSTKFELGHVLSSFAFFPHLHPVLGSFYPSLVPGWSLNYEMFFYLLFAIALMFSNRLVTLGTVFGSIVVAVAAGYIFKPAGLVAAFYAAPIMLEFALGLVAGVLYTHVRRAPFPIALLAIPASFAAIVAAGIMLTVDNGNRAFLIGIPAGLLVWGISQAKRHNLDFKNQLAVVLGNASYSIYLTQVIVLPVGGRLWAFAGIGYDGWRLGLFMAFELCVAATAGWVTHRLIEKPLLHYLPLLTTRKPRPMNTVLQS